MTFSFGNGKAVVNLLNEVGRFVNICQVFTI